MKYLHPSLKLFYSLIIAFLIVSVSHAETMTGDQSKQTRVSTNGTYEVTVESWLKPLQLGRMHAWTATIHTTEGKPVTGAKIKIGGGMPIHNHGFPTEPEVTKQLEDGVYLIEGIKFNMSGPWILFLDISSDGITDSVAFDIDL